MFKRLAIDIAGFGLMILAPFLGWLPGPGGIPLFLAGLGLVSINHHWARRLLKDFDMRRMEFTDKYLMAGWVFSLLLDVICFILLCTGVYISFTSDNILVRGMSIGIGMTAFIIILSNQKRLDRIVAKLKRK